MLFKYQGMIEVIVYPSVAVVSTLQDLWFPDAGTFHQAKH